MMPASVPLPAAHADVIQHGAPYIEEVYGSEGEGSSRAACHAQEIGDGMMMMILRWTACMSLDHTAILSSSIRASAHSYMHILPFTGSAQYGTTFPSLWPPMCKHARMRMLAQTHKNTLINTHTCSHKRAHVLTGMHMPMLKIYAHIRALSSPFDSHPATIPSHTIVCTPGSAPACSGCCRALGVLGCVSSPPAPPRASMATCQLKSWLAFSRDATLACCHPHQARMRSAPLLSRCPWTGWFKHWEK